MQPSWGSSSDDGAGPFCMEGLQGEGLPLPPHPPPGWLCPVWTVRASLNPTSSSPLRYCQCPVILDSHVSPLLRLPVSCQESQSHKRWPSEACVHPVSRQPLPSPQACTPRDTCRSPHPALSGEDAMGVCLQSLRVGSGTALGNGVTG